jgi:glutathione S-transferase
MNNSNSPLIRIHGAFPYDRGAKSRWLLTELGVPFENHWLRADAGELEKPAHLRLHPMGRIPAMEYGDTTMFESGAMCAYLADQFIDRGLAPQLSSPHRAKYQQWMYFAASTLDPVQTRIMVIEDIPAGEIRTTKEAALLGEFRDAVSALDQTLSKSPFLVEGRFSAADICVGYHLYWTMLWPELETIVCEFPSVVAYLDRLKNLPSAIESKVFSYSG